MQYITLTLSHIKNNWTDDVFRTFVLHSETATKLKIKNTIEDVQFSNAKGLFEKVVKPILEKYGEIRITSWHRNDALNKIISTVGSKSQHRKGMAVDFYVPGTPHEDVFLWCKYNLKFDQLILETNKTGGRWLHISYVGNKNRQQAFGLTGQESK